MKARYNKPKSISYYDTAGDVATASLLTAELYDPNAALAHTVTFTRAAEVPELLVSSAFQPLKVGQYTVYYTYNGTVLLTEYLDVGAHPIPDFPIQSAVTLRLDADLAGGAGETVTVKVYGSDAVQDVDVGATYVAASAAYEASHTFTAEGDYFLVWLKEVTGTPTQFYSVALSVRSPADKETITFTAYSEEGGANAPHQATTVVFCDESGAQHAKTVTDVGGFGTVDLVPGSYRASMIKTGVVFTANNYYITVVDTATEVGNNVFQLSSYSFTPTVSDPNPPTDMCTLTADIYRMNGEPLAIAAISVRLVHRAQLFSGNVVFDTGITEFTDHHGHAEFDLVQGIQVEIAIVPLSLRRTITVPSSAGPVNLMTLLASADDVFDLVTPTNIPTAPVRTL